MNYIGKCIQSLIDNSYPKNLISIYVCDGMSNDGTRKLVQTFIDNYNHIFLLDNIKRTTPIALNLGLKKSTSDIKIILGAHSEVDENFILENVKAINLNSEIGCVGGVLENVYENDVSKIIGLAMSSSFGVGNAHFRTGNKNGYVDTVAFGAYKKEVFNAVGYFDESLDRNQDDEFNFRLTKHGFKIFLSEKIKCKYFVRASYKKLFRQYFQYGYWKVFVNKKHKTITSLRQLIPVFFVLFLITSLIIGVIAPKLLIVSAIILSFYIILSFKSSLSLTNKIKNNIKIPFVFFILHISYGLGYLMGVIDFLIRFKKPNSKAKTLTR